MESTQELFLEYNDLFLATFLEMKGVSRELGEMKILLRPDSIPIKLRPYRMNPVYKEKVNA
jgi:hypothetical protein